MESPSRIVKEELIEREDNERGSRKVWDGKVSSESTEEIERIFIEDSMEGESYRIRSVGQEERIEGEDELVPREDILTPVMESTPVEGREMQGRRLGFRPVTAPKKKLWVPTEPSEEVTEVKQEDEKSSSGDSSASQRSPLSIISSGRRVPENEVPLHLRAPRGYGDRATKVHVRFNERTGLREVIDGEGGDQMLTEGGTEGTSG